MRGGDPYRSPPTAPGFVCVVCYRSLSALPGESSPRRCACSSAAFCPPDPEDAELPRVLALRGARVDERGWRRYCANR